MFFLAVVYFSFFIFVAVVHIGTHMPVDPSLYNIVTELVQRPPASATAKLGLWTLEPTEERKYLQAFHVLDGTWANTGRMMGFATAPVMAGMAGAVWRLHRVRKANTLKRMERGPGARRAVLLAAWPYASAPTARRRRAPPAITMARAVARNAMLGLN